MKRVGIMPDSSWMFLRVLIRTLGPLRLWEFTGSERRRSQPHAGHVLFDCKPRAAVNQRILCLLKVFDAAP